MSNSNDTNINQKNIEFNDAKQNEAYLELCAIFRRAIETQDYSSLEPSIAIWKHKYNLDNLSDIEKVFTNPEIARKIKAILNRDYLSRLIGDYITSRILAEQQNQQEHYDNLKKIIEKANKNKDYKTAKKEVEKWRQNLYDDGFNIYGFNKIYTKNILRMLLLPSQELAKQQEVSDAFKSLTERSREMTSDELSSEITSLQNKYSLDTFPDDLKKELNDITTDVISSILQKRNEETALFEIQEYVSSENKNSPADEIPKILSKYDYDKFSDEYKNKISNLSVEAMSLAELTIEDTYLESAETNIPEYIPPVQRNAILDLKTIFEKNAYDIQGLFDWIYLNRKIDFVPAAVEEIKAMFSMAGFKKPESSEYMIPSLETDAKNLSFKDISRIQEQVVLNYLGILYTNNRFLSTDSKDKISEIHKKEAVLSVVGENVETKKAQIVIPVQDDIALTSESNYAENDTPYIELPKEDDTNLNTSSSSLLEGKDFDSKEELDESSDEITIIIDNLLENPLETFEIAPVNREDDHQDKEPEKEEYALKPNHLDSNLTTLSEPEISEQNTSEIHDTISSVPNNEEKSTSSLEVENTDIYDSHLLTVNDQIALEEINYIIIGSLLNTESTKLISKGKKKTNDFQVEKNNGF